MSYSLQKFSHSTVTTVLQSLEHAPFLSNTSAAQHISTKVGRFNDLFKQGS